MATIPPEIWTHIGAAINDGATWKSWIFTCSMFASMNTELMILKHSNPLWSLILEFPNGSWDWHDICENPWTTLNVIQKYSRRELKWNVLANHLHFTNEFLEDAFAKHHRLFIYAGSLSSNPSLPFEFVLNHPELTWDINELSSCVSLDAIKQNFHLQWNWSCVALNPNVTVDFINEVGSHNSGPIKWNFEALSYNPNITYEFFETHKDKGWNFKALSQNNPSVKLEWLELMPDAPWNFDLLSDNDDAERMLLRFPNADWSFDSLSHNRNIHIETVLKFENAYWDFDFVVCNHKFDINNLPESPKITFPLLILNEHLKGMKLIDIIKKDGKTEIIFLPAPDVIIPPATVAMYLPHDIACAITEEYFPKSYYNLSCNHNLSWLYVKNHPKKNWSFDALSSNPFGRTNKDLCQWYSHGNGYQYLYPKKFQNYDNKTGEFIMPKFWNGPDSDDLDEYDFE
jgi:hypothetical protein